MQSNKIKTRFCVLAAGTAIISFAVPQAAQAALCALSDSALRSVPRESRDTLRADILKQILIHLV